jgi:DNA-binding response OmpR family regulator
MPFSSSSAILLGILQNVRGGFVRVLIVEDERKLAAYVKRGLEEQGYAVDVAYTGREAIGWTEVVIFDLIILDVLLPELNGLEVCRTLRQRGLRMPILMLTARDTIDDRVAGLDAGADDYLIKPFALKELLARLRALLRRATDLPKATTLTLADLTLDTLTHRVKRAGQLIELTAKEYAVLECLMREPDRVLTRTVIAEHVWNYDVFNQSNIVDVYIRNLRRKIDDTFAIKLIQTIRGAGYRLSIEHETL